MAPKNQPINQEQPKNLMLTFFALNSHENDANMLSFTLNILSPVLEILARKFCCFSTR